jgi:glutathione peroxidase
MSLYDFSVKTIDGQIQTLEPFRGRILLIVNVASQCLFTSQYRGLEALYRKHRAEGLVILGFPCDQFAKQEFGREERIKQFCSLKYDVTFPMFAKVKVNGANAHPLYQYLKSARRGTLGTRAIKWNFTKFLVNRDGAVVKRYGPAALSFWVERGIRSLLRSPNASLVELTT